jgi:Protein of unknown function (DUF2484)
MSAPLIAACLWVLAATVTALLPMRRQFPPGIVLLALAPVLLVWIGWQHGAIWAMLGLAGFLSMFRNPLIYFWKKWRGLPVDLPPELREGGGK